ncbi:hypothetical protein IRJ41_008259 [Triplophysa rosa]|uniref:DUF6729 domain-containing protein n=1 Tax=Triplophysa rosa TaxID=992332 RepID=A0A9W7WSK6_TRIRA|nr:hypothetical protein IRJ41_008259 [Triplophysa rosa]
MSIPAINQKVVLITGCSSGIGLALAARIAKDEKKRFLVYATMRNLTKGAALVEAAGRTLGRTLEIKQLDVCDETSIKACVDSLPVRRVDILISNAGLGLIGPIECQSIDEMKTVMDTNFFGLVRLLKEVLPDMKKRKSGHIVVMSSVMGIQGNISLIEPGPVITEFERKVYEECLKIDLSTADKVHPPVTVDASQSTHAQSTPSISDVSHSAKMAKLTLSMVSSQPEDPVDLPLLWPQTMPQQDQKWVSEALFRVGAKGKLELRENLQLWYHPPQPALLYHQAPTPARFFSQRLLLWMPYRLWKVRLQCTNPACARHHLCGGGLHRRVRQVLDIDRYYNLVTETLICTRCRTSYLSWSHTVLQQLDLAHRSEFRVILTLLRLLRERGMGNGPVRIIGQLRENHSEEWLKSVARYTSECVAFLDNPGLNPLHFQEPPPLAPVPRYKWLLTVYSQDILNRLHHIKASITSTYGSILKMDSTKKITKKLSGPAKGTAQWLTSVGNEVGQVLMSVLTANEGAGLDLMAAGLMERYQRAGVDPPTILYVDCDCCKEVGETKLKRRFSGWPDVIVRQDIWHFMRRLADAGDLTLLRKAKREQLTQQGWPAMTEAELDRHISKDELAQHCRRRTRGEETTIRLLDMLIRQLMGGKGNDAHGILLLDSVRMQHIWHVQRRQVTCIQDPPDVLLYTETGTLIKGGMVLKTYLCARGSTSLESFHCHLNRFIPGNSTNSLNFQIYLLEGLLRWNLDRAAAAVPGVGSTLRTYTGELVYSVNQNYNKLYGRKLVPNFTPPAVHTALLDPDLSFHTSTVQSHSAAPASRVPLLSIAGLRFGPSTLP